MADLEAQAKGSGLDLCEKCFAMIPVNSEFCPECGAPTRDEPAAEGSDLAIYPELARANLLRMRGEFKQAEDVCLHLLKRYPNNATANSLLGDICAERGDLQQAAEWYDLALDLHPDDTAVRAKLDSVQSRIRTTEAASTAQMLGLPASKSKVPWIAAGLLVLISGAVLAAFFAGKNVQQPKPKLGWTEQNQFVVGDPDSGKAGENPPEHVDKPAPQVPVVVGSIAVEDRSILDSLAKHVPSNMAIQNLLHDPRSRAMFVTFNLPEGEEPRFAGARMAALVFQNEATTGQVQVRGLRGGSLVFVADAARSAYEVTASEDWKKANGNEPAALANAILTNEWPQKSAEQPTAAIGNSSGAEEPRPASN